MSGNRLEDRCPRGVDLTAIKRSLIHRPITTKRRWPSLNDYGMGRSRLHAGDRGWAEGGINVWYGEEAIFLPVYDKQGQARLWPAPRVRRLNRLGFHIVCPLCKGEHLRENGEVNLDLDACPAKTVAIFGCAIPRCPYRGGDEQQRDLHVATCHPTEAHDLGMDVGAARQALDHGDPLPFRFANGRYERVRP